MMYSMSMNIYNIYSILFIIYYVVCIIIDLLILYVDIGIKQSREITCTNYFHQYRCYHKCDNASMKSIMICSVNTVGKRNTDYVWQSVSIHI